MRFRSWIFLLPVLVLNLGCRVPPVPPEVKDAQTQETNLWRAGSITYAPAEYKRYKRYYQDVLGRFYQEKNKFSWFRNYKDVKAEFATLLAEGARIEKLVQQRKNARAVKALDRLNNLEEKVTKLITLTGKVNEGRSARGDLTRADLTLAQAKYAFREGRYDETNALLNRVESYLKRSGKVLRNLLERYGNTTQVSKWQRMINETIAESRRKRIAAIIVNKIDRELILYKNGQPQRTFRVGLGRNDLQDKRHAGDNATPEGRYYIVKKLPSSQYYKALLLNYPNDEDRRNFAAARKNGLVPQRVGIGGLVEIHGGGISFMTRGCVSLENDDMDVLFKLTGVNTPVTIVGSADYPSHILSLLADE